MPIKAFEGLCLMDGFNNYLKTYADAANGDRARSDIAQVSQTIREQKLYSGQPRSAETEKAKARALAALKLASQTDDKLLMAEACRLMGNTLSASEQYSDSLEYYCKAVGLFEATGSPEQAARTRLGFMAALFMTGNYKESLAVATAAERWFQANDHRSGLAKVYANLGNFHYRQGQHAIGLEYHRKSQDLFEHLQDWHAVAISYLNVGNGLSSTNGLIEAQQSYDACEELCARYNLRELFMQARYNKSYLMFLNGNHSPALESFSAVRKYFASNGSLLHVHLCDLDVAEIFLHLRYPHEAVPPSSRAIEGFSSMKMRYEHAKGLAFYAMAISQLERLEEAENAAIASRRMFEEEGNRYWISIVDFCLAALRLARGDASKAHLLATQAKIQFREPELKPGMAESLDRLGSLATESSQIRTAAACMTELLKLTINKRR